MSKKGNTAISDAILQTVEYQTLPDSDTVAASTLDSSGITQVIKGIQNARDDVEAEIRTLSRGVASDVDEWIAQAKKLQSDIESSRDTAREIVKQAEEATLLREEYNDAARKVELLQLEVRFTSSLQRTLQEFQKITCTLQEAQDTVVGGQYLVALNKLDSTDQLAPRGNGQENTNAVAIIHQRASKVRQNLVEDIENLLHKCFFFDESMLQFSLPPPETDNLDIENLLEVLTRLDLIESKVSWLASRLGSCIFGPLLANKADMSIGEVQIHAHTIQIQGTKIASDASVILSEITKAIHFLNEKLPTRICTQLSQILIPPLTSRLTSYWLPKYIPTDVAEVSEFETLLHSVASFANELTAMSWSGGVDLTEWVDQGPKLWLSKRREASLLVVRNSLSENISKTQTVERVETQVVSQGEVMANITDPGATDDNDDWDAGWQDESQGNGVEDVKEEEEADSSAWGFDNDGDDEQDKLHDDKSQPTEADAHDEKQDEDAAWGWDEEETQHSPVNHEPIAKQQTESNGKSTTLKQETRELTLKELYTITAVPDELHGMIKKVIQDAKTLRLTSYENTLIGPAAAALFSLPTLILAGFRALAPSYYMPLIGGNMYLYNDCVRLALVLTSTAKEQAEEDEQSELPKSSWPSIRMKLDADITALESFGKRAYGREMESQRTILRDLLDGTQGFANCSEAPFASECQNAITSTVERVLEVERQWRGILSRSALLQSLGSLVSTVIGKIIVDIEDLSDISEPESQQLRKYCDSVGKLADVFREENPTDPSQKSDMIGIYVPSWFKFQYLSEIMDLSLVNIRHFWMEGGLKLEFEAEEVVDLIQALFAESDHRRKAIAEIRRS